MSGMARTIHELVKHFETAKRVFIRREITRKRGTIHGSLI
jgi:hypothetical protein